MASRRSGWRALAAPQTAWIALTAVLWLATPPAASAASTYGIDGYMRMWVTTPAQVDPNFVVDLVFDASSTITLDDVLDSVNLASSGVFALYQADPFLQPVGNAIQLGAFSFDADYVNVIFDPLNILDFRVVGPIPGLGSNGSVLSLVGPPIVSLDPVGNGVIPLFDKACNIPVCEPFTILPSPVVPDRAVAWYGNEDSGYAYHLDAVINIPEPSTLLLMGTGLAVGAAAARARVRRRARRREGAVPA